MLLNISSLDAYDIIASNIESSILFDVRTSLEWQEGLPAVDNLFCISWRRGDYMSANPSFKNDALRAITDMHASIFFICRGGVRSHDAMLSISQEQQSSAQQRNYYNIIDGFAGWRSKGLPVKGYELEEFKAS